jgi:hypothetical protein
MADAAVASGCPATRTPPSGPRVGGRLLQDCGGSRGRSSHHNASRWTPRAWSSAMVTDGPEQLADTDGRDGRRAGAASGHCGSGRRWTADSGAVHRRTHVQPGTGCNCTSQDHHGRWPAAYRWLCGASFEQDGLTVRRLVAPGWGEVRKRFRRVDGQVHHPHAARRSTLVSHPRRRMPSDHASGRYRSLQGLEAWSGNQLGRASCRTRMVR